MAGIMVTIVVYILTLAAIFGGLCLVTGEEDKGNQIIVSCMTAIVLLMMILMLFSAGGSSPKICISGLPLVENVQKAGSLKDFITQSPGQFALDFVELVTLMLLIHWASNLYKATDAGFAGKILSRFIIVGIAVIVYGFVMDTVREHILMKWAVYCVECMITGTAVLYTPAMAVAFITGWKSDNPAVTYAVSQFPKTSIGKAISEAISASVVLIAFLLVLESQYGSVQNIMGSVLDSLGSMGACVLMLMGIYFMVTSLKKKK